MGVLLDIRRYYWVRVVKKAINSLELRAVTRLRYVATVFAARNGDVKKSQLRSIIAPVDQPTARVLGYPRRLVKARVSMQTGIYRNRRLLYKHWMLRVGAARRLSVTPLAPVAIL